MKVKWKEKKNLKGNHSLIGKKGKKTFIKRSKNKAVKGERECLWGTFKGTGKGFL